MHVLVTGANGFVERSLDCRSSSIVQRHAGDLSDSTWLDELLDGMPTDVVFHLASIPGGTAEAQYALSRRVNLDATLDLLERGRAQVTAGGAAPVFVFASSIAVFGPMPEVVTDETLPRPSMTYGAQKLVSEVLVDDFSRRGWVDGRSLRLPGVLARSPARTGQQSAFFSDIIRELAAGRPFVCPTSAQAMTWASSLPNVVDNLLHAALLDVPAKGGRRTFMLPTSRFSMAQLVSAIAERHGPRVAGLVRFEPDAMIEERFGRFPPLDARAAEAAGFMADESLQEPVRLALAAG